MDNLKFFQWYNDLLESTLPFYKNWYIISKYQKDISDNYKSMFFYIDVFKSFIQLVPTHLWQAINPWSFSLLRFTKEIKGNPSLEHKILTEVAGYGSQLGTITDFIEILEKTYPIDVSKLKQPEDIYRYYKYKLLIENIEKAKKEL